MKLFNSKKNKNHGGLEAEQNVLDAIAKRLISLYNARCTVPGNTRRIVMLTLLRANRGISIQWFILLKPLVWIYFRQPFPKKTLKKK